MLSDEELQNLAKEELLRDVKSASVRAEMYGAHRWAKPKMLFTNKRFLKHMILSSKRDRVERKHLSHESHRKSEKKSSEKSPDDEAEKESSDKQCKREENTTTAHDDDRTKEKKIYEKKREPEDRHNPKRRRK